LAKLKGSLKLTKTSSTVGTLAYMAPEQIQGEQVDARSDIFSFGIVLYEMLTGHLPFRGEHDAAMMYSIVNEEPEPLQHYVPDAPSELLHILDRALEKDREDRYQAVHEMLIDLRRLKKDSMRVSMLRPLVGAPIQSDPGVAPVRGPLWQKRWLLSGLAAVVVVGIGATLLLVLPAGRVKLKPERSISMLAIPTTKVHYPAISRDGNWVVFPAGDENGRWDVYWMNSSGGEPSRITHELWFFVHYVDVSPDAGHVVYQCFREGEPSEIRTVPIQGGASRVVADSGSVPRWSPDGKRIGYVRRPSLSASKRFEVWSVRPDGSDNRCEFIDTTNSQDRPISFCWSPDGTSIAWVRNFSPGHGDVMVREISTGRERQVTRDMSMVDDVHWPDEERMVFVSNKSGHSNLWAIPAAGGEAIQVTEGAVPVLGARMSADSRTLVYLQQERFAHLWVSSLDGGNARQLTSDDLQINWAAYSPDGEYIASALGSADTYRPESHLYIMRNDGKNRRQLTSGAEVVLACFWSPDGKWLLYVSHPAGESQDSGNIYLIQPSNPGTPRAISTTGTLVYSGDWSPDGKWFAYSSHRAGESQDSGRVYLIQASKLGEPRLIGDGTEVRWTDSVALLVTRRDTTFWQYSLRGGNAREISADLAPEDPTKRMFDRIRDIPVAVVVLPPDKKFLLYQIQGSREIWRVRASGGKEERVGTIPSANTNLMDVTRNGQEILLIQNDTRSRLAVIRNLFE
jgi:Tol biopolymer transport system component